MQSKHLPFLYAVFLGLQVFLFDHVEEYYRFSMYPYVIGLLLLPSRYSPSRSMLLGFGTGLLIDLFSSSLGLHASACTLVGLTRRPVIHTLRSRYIHTESSLPTLQHMGFRWSVEYGFVMCLLHHGSLYVVSSLPSPHWWLLLARMLVSAVLSTLLYVLVQLPFRGGSSRR